MNTKIVKLDINKKLYEKIQAKQGDTKSRFLLFHLLDGAVQFSLVGRTVRVYGLKPDNKEFFNDLQIVDVNKGYCKLELTSQALAVPGDLDLELVIMEGESKLSSIPFVVEVIKSLNSKSAIESSNEYKALDRSLTKVEEWNNEFADKSGKLEQLYTERLNGLGTQLAEKAKQSDLIVERKRIDNLASLTEGSTTGDAELIDGRVGADGITYKNVGGSIRGQLVKKADNPSSYVEIPLTKIDGLMNQKNGNIAIIKNYSHFEIDVIENETYRYNGYHISADFAVIIFKNSSNQMVGQYLPNPIVSSGKLIDFVFNTPLGATKMFINTNNTTPYKLEKLMYSNLTEQFIQVKNDVEILKNTTTTVVPPTSNNIIETNLEDYLWQISNSAWVNNPTWYKHKAYTVSEKIAVKARCQGMNDSCPAIMCFSSNGTLLYSYSTNTDKIENYEFITPVGTTKVVLNGTSSYVPSLAIKKTYNGNEIATNNLYGKKISGNGDSIMYGLGYVGGFLKIIADKNNMTLNNIAVSGGTLSDPNNVNVHWIGGTISNMDSDSDYYIIEGGYNDWSYNTNSLGSITQTMTDTINTRTIYGGMEDICRKLLKTFVGKKIGFVITHKILTSAYTDKGKGFTMSDVHDAIVKVLNKYSISYCDLFNNSCLNTEMSEYLKYTNANDGVHPNELGYNLFYVPKVEAWLKTL